MPIRLSGMQSGLDTEALVSALVMGYRTKKEDYEKAVDVKQIRAWEELQIWMEEAYGGKFL